jgi:hypothetical protein
LVLSSSFRNPLSKPPHWSLSELFMSKFKAALSKTKHFSYYHLSLASCHFTGIFTTENLFEMIYKKPGIFTAHIHTTYDHKQRPTADDETSCGI